MPHNWDMFARYMFHRAKPARAIDRIRPGQHHFASPAQVIVLGSGFQMGLARHGKERRRRLAVLRMRDQLGRN